MALLLSTGASRDEGFIVAKGSPYRAGSHASSVAAADFDGDGNTDILAACSGTDSVALLLGTGRGELRSPRSFRALAMPHLLAVGDFNGDRRPDAVVSAHDDDNVVVLRNDGRGRLVRQAPIHVFDGPKPHNHGLAVGDVNGDGLADITVGHQDLGTIAVLLGDGRGGFRAGPGSPVAAGRAPYPHALADMNGDHHLDLVVPDVTGNRVRLFAGDGTGRFLPLTAISTGMARPYFVIARDVNGDGKTDLIVTHDDTHRVAALLGDGRGRFRHAPTSPFDGRAPSWKGDVADLTRDGNVDLALAGGGSVRVFSGDGRGGFRFRSSLSTRGESWDVTLVDMNGNARPDIVAPSGAAGAIHVFLAP